MTPSAFFLGRVTAVLGGGDYSFLEYWLQGGAALPTAKVAGKYGGALNPGRAVNGAALAVGDWVLVRSAAGEGGLKWELVPVSAGSALAYDSATLAAPFTPANSGLGVTQNVGVTLTIPAAGTYLISGTVNAVGIVSAYVGEAYGYVGVNGSFLAVLFSQDRTGTIRNSAGFSVPLALAAGTLDLTVAVTFGGSTATLRIDSTPTVSLSYLKLG